MAWSEKYCLTEFFTTAYTFKARSRAQGEMANRGDNGIAINLTQHLFSSTTQRNHHDHSAKSPRHAVCGGPDRHEPGLERLQETSRCPAAGSGATGHGPCHASRHAASTFSLVRSERSTRHTADRSGHHTGRAASRCRRHGAASHAI